MTGACALDVDADGPEDFILLRSDKALALRGLGACRFERADEAWSFIGGDAWWTALAAAWEARRDWPPLAPGAYIDRRGKAFPWGACTDNVLIRPAQDGSGFAPPVPLLTPSRCALSMLFTNWDRTGRRDLRVSNDRECYKGGQVRRRRLDPGAAPRLWTEAEGWARPRVWGTGIASADINHVGFPETFPTSMADNKLQRLAEPRGEAGPRISLAPDAFHIIDRQGGASRWRPG